MKTLYENVETMALFIKGLNVEANEQSLAALEASREALTQADPFTPLHLRIQGEGRAKNTVVRDRETGRPLRTRSATWRCECGENGERKNVVTLELTDVEINVDIPFPDMPELLSDFSGGVYKAPEPTT